MASLFLTFTGEYRLAFTLMGEALSSLVLGVYVMCIGTVRRDMLSSMCI